MTSERIYKVLGLAGTPCHGGSGAWPLPTDGKPGSWRSVGGELVACAHGLHLCRGEIQLLEWLGPQIYEAEYRGDAIHAGDKIVVRTARLIRRAETWNERTARLFAADCAEHVLDLFERVDPNDSRPGAAIAAARAYARGEITQDELTTAEHAAYTAARPAARTADRTAAYAAALSAARATAYAAGYAATLSAGYEAAYAAGYAAALTAARAAAYAAERQWQAERLRAYLDGEVA